jgi:UDP-N-acetylmuramoyl-tripeptide--D-alanyl-D-alanine ligase
MSFFQKNIGQKQRLVTSIIISACLTLLSFTAETEIGIVEMGANHKNEIEFLCELAMPDYGYIQIFKAHLKDLVALQV